MCKHIYISLGIHIHARSKEEVDDDDDDPGHAAVLDGEDAPRYHTVVLHDKVYENYRSTCCGTVMSVWEEKHSFSSRVHLDPCS